MSRKLFALAASAVLICGPAFAADASVAQLGAVKGSVMVSQNGKMVAASAGGPEPSAPSRQLAGYPGLEVIPVSGQAGCLQTGAAETLP
jgi:hypothetical protein